MDNPVEEISDVILALTTTPPSVQQAAIDKYFTQDAEFVHPFCRTLQAEDSRFQIHRIYRWYKIMSPQISLRVNSVAWDEHNSILYVDITQIFSVYFLPFHKAEVNLVTVLHLVQTNNQLDAINGSKDGNKSLSKRKAGGGGKWYIKCQNDLYQTDQFSRFVAPATHFIIPWLQYFATLLCVVCSYIFYPVTMWAESKPLKFHKRETPQSWNKAR